MAANPFGFGSPIQGPPQPIRPSSPFGFGTQDPRIGRYTTLMQQADPGQRQQLIGHLVDQFNNGNQSVAPYLQDLQAKGLLSEKGLSAQSSAPIQRSTPGFTGIGDAVATVGNFVNQGMIQPINRSLVRPIESNLYDIGHGNLSSLTPASSVRNTPTSQGNPFIDKRNQIQRLADNAAAASSLATPGIGAAEGSVIGNVAKASLGNALMGSGLSGVQAVGDGATTAQTAQAMKQGFIAGGALGALGGGIGAAASRLHPGLPSGQKGSLDLGGDVTGKEPTLYRGVGKNAEMATGKTMLGNQFGDGLYASPNKEWAAQYGNLHTVEVSKGAKFHEVIREISPEGVGSLYDRKTGLPLEHTPGMTKFLDKYDAGDEAKAYAEWARSSGYDGIKVYDASHGDKLNEVVMFDKGRAKLSPVKAEAPKSSPTPTTQYPVGTKVDPSTGRPIVEQSRNKNGQYGNKLPSKPGPFSHLTDDLPIPNEHDPGQVVDAYNNVANRYNTALDHEASLSRTPAMRKANAATLTNLQHVKAELYNEAMAHRANGLNNLGLEPEVFGIDARQPGQSGSLELSGEVGKGKNEKLPMAKSLHLDEPTPYESVNISDRKAVGSAVDRTQAYIKRIDQTLATDPTNIELRNRRLQLARELQELKKGYHNTGSLTVSDPELDKWANMTPEAKAEYEKAQAQFINDRGGAENKKLSDEERWQIIENEERQQTKNQVSMKVPEGSTPKAGARMAIAKATGVAQEADDRLLEAQKTGKKLNDHDAKLLYRVENGEDVRTVAKDAENKKLFKENVSKLQDGFDYALSALRAAGTATFRQHDYIIPHYYKATAEQMDELGINPEDRVTIKGQSGFHDKSAKYDSYIKAEAAGLHPLFDNPMDAVDQYRKGATSYIRNYGLLEALKSGTPNDVAPRGDSRDNQGRTFNQAAGKLPFEVTDEVNEALKNFRSTKISNPAFRVAYASLRAVNSLQKAVLFFGAPFHYSRITSNFLGLTTSTGHELLAGQGVKDALLASLTPEGHAKAIAEARADGTLAYLREEMGGSINDDHAPYRPDTLIGNIKGALDKINLLGMTHRNMNRFIDAYALAFARVAKNAGVHGEEAVALGHELNMVLGRINAAVQGHNPFISKLLGDAGLAPMFARAELGLARDAVTKSSPVAITVKGHTLLEKGTAKTGLGMTNAGDVARSTVLGTRALEAAIAITGSAVISGHMPTFHQLLAQAGFLPNDPVPNIDLHHKNKSGHNQVMVLPPDPAGLAANLVTDPKHFGNARLSPTLSFINRVTTNTDWNGNELVDKSKPGWEGKLLVEAAKGGLPIGVQNLMGAMSGKLTPGQAVAQEFGGRVKTDPNDPNVQSSTLSYKNQDKGRAALGTNDQAAWDTIFPKTKMADGTYTQAANFNPFKAADKVYTLLSHPAVLDQAIKSNQATPGHDPMWDLPKDQLTTFLTYQGIQGTDYGIATAKEIEATNPWIADLNQQRSDWFNTLPPSKNPDGANPIAYPKLDDQTQALMTLESQLTKIPANQRSPWQTQQLNQLYNNPQLTAAYNQLNQYTQDRRAQQNVPQFAQAPVVTPYLQAQMNAGNWSDPYVQSYLNASTAFKASGPFGDGIGGAGGNHNTSAIALANLAQGLTASGKPSSYARASSSSRNSAARRNLKNEFKYAIKDVKYAGKKMKNNLKYQHHVAGTYLPKLQNQPVLTAQQHAARNHAIAKAKNASKRHIA